MITVRPLSRMSRNAKLLALAIPVACVLLVISVPDLMHSRHMYSKNSCINLLRQLEGAKDQWMRDNSTTTNDVPTWDDLRGYLKGPWPYRCPDGGVYTIGRVRELPTCSIPRHTEYWRTNHW
jgi:hypothetical protein